MNLAIHGGNPVRGRSYHKWPLQDEDVRSRLASLFDQAEWGQTTSSIVQEFEQKFAWYHDCKFAVSVVNAFTALVTALKTLKVGPGDEVLLSTYCHPAVAAAVVACNAVPIFADIREASLDMDPESVDRRVTERAKALIVTHPAGCAAHTDELMVVARRYHLRVVEECLQAIGAEFDNRKVGSVGDLGVFGFDEHRLLTSGQGGMIISNHKELVDRASALLHEGKWPVQAAQTEFLIGSSGGLTSLQASVLLPQLEKLDDLNTLRALRAEALGRLLGTLPGIKVCKPHAQVSRQALEGYPFSYVPAEFNNAGLDRFLAALQGEGIAASPGYPTAYESRHFRLQLEHCPYRCRFYPFPYYLAKSPRADEAAKTTVLLDHLNLIEDEEDLALVAQALDKLRRYKHEI